MLAWAVAARAGEVRLVSAADSNTATGNDFSAHRSLSAEGRWVLFFSEATDLVAGFQDANGTGGDLFLFDRITGARKLLSASAGAPSTTGNGSSPSGQFSADSRWIAFTSSSTNLVPGQTSTNPAPNDLFLHDRVTGATILVSGRHGSPVQGSSSGGTFGAPVLSADGRYVAWSSTSPDIEEGFIDNNGFDPTDIHLFDRETGTVAVVSHKDGAPLTGGNRWSYSPRITPDGRYIVFLSGASDLFAGQIDPNNAGIPANSEHGLDVFVRDRAAGTTTLVSHAAGSAATTANGISTYATFSADGRFVAFTSQATNLVSGVTDANGGQDVFLQDRDSGTAILVSHAAGAATTAANGAGYYPMISADGRWILFESFATDLVSGVTDANGQGDLFLYDRLSGTTALVSASSLSPAATANGGSDKGWISADGSRIGFSSRATDLLPAQDDTNGALDLFLYNRLDGIMTLISRTPDSPEQTGNDESGVSVGSSDGLTVLLTSLASDLVPGDGNGIHDAFLFTVAPPGAFFTLPACRLLDTRQPQDGPALASDVPEILTLHGVCGIPATARAVAVNVTITQPTGPGHLTLYTGDASPPLASTINFGAGQTRANNAILALATNGTGTLAARPAIAGGGTVHVILDVVGYFE